MNCEQELKILAEGEQEVTLINDDWESIINLNKECLCVVPDTDRDYTRLKNKPSINGVELVGDRSSSEIHVQHEMDRITEQMIDNIIY